MVNHEIKGGVWFGVPAVLASLYRVVDSFEVLFPGSKFTPDGHLVGSIGEVIAARMFNLKLLKASTPVHDAIAADGRTFGTVKADARRYPQRETPALGDSPFGLALSVGHGRFARL